MSNVKRFLLLGSIGVVLLAGLIFTLNSKVSTAHANGCTTVAENWIGVLTWYQAYWGSAPTCTEGEGDTSNAVYGIQLDINESGTTNPQTHARCNAGTPDGDFGSNTYNAVVCFQKAWNAAGNFHISVDGVVGPQTWTAISNYVKGQFNSSGWNYFHGNNTSTTNFRMWGQSPYKWEVNAGGCWRQMDTNSTGCS